MMILLIYVILVPNFAYGQKFQTEHKITTLYLKQNNYLNGKLKLKYQ